MKSSARPSPVPDLTPRQIYEHLDRFVIGQTKAKRTVAIAAYNHLKRCSVRAAAQKKLLKKANLLLMGPTGCGKTHIARNLADLLEVPFTVVDATEYTEAGYYGKDVEVMIAELLFKAEHSVEDTERGIVFIDEIDKIARKSQGARNGAGSRDIGGEGVQQSILKLLEGREVFVPMNVTQHWNKHDFVQVNTQNILFICAGTFSDIHMYEQSKSLGFGAEATAPKKRRITVKKLVEYGMLAELLGRIPVMVDLDPLSEDELLRVLVEPPDSLLREYTQLFALDGVDVDFQESALREIVHYATERGLGARALRSIFEEICHDLMFEAPELRGKKVAVDAELVKSRVALLEGTALGE